MSLSFLDPQDKRFLKFLTEPGGNDTSPKRWAVICLDKVEPDQLRHFVQHLAKQAHLHGLNFGRPDLVAPISIENSKNIFDAFYNIAKKVRPDFVFVGILKGIALFFSVALDRKSVV